MTEITVEHVDAIATQASTAHHLMRVLGVPLSWADSIARAAPVGTTGSAIVDLLRCHGWPDGGVIANRRQAMYAMDAATYELTC